MDDNEYIIISKKELEHLSELITSISIGKPLDQYEEKIFENEELKLMSENIYKLFSYITELNKYSVAISQGDLNYDFPPRKNYLASGLKQLHSNLLHLVWKVNKIALGNYDQKVEYMGELSDAFNKMIVFLFERNKQIEEFKRIIEVIKLSSDIMFYVVEVESGEMIYNNADATGSDFTEFFMDSLKYFNNNPYIDDEKSYEEWEFFYNIDEKWYKVMSLEVTWTESRRAYFHILVDITDEKRKIRKLELEVNFDNMVGTYNHTFSINKVRELLTEKKDFTICFVDLDGLKSANDKFGHYWGDRFLIKLVEIFINCTRDEDFFCRIGGDEFLLISPDLTEEEVDLTVKNVQAKVKEFNNLKVFPFEISFSYGIEESSNESYFDPSDLIKAADKKMYEHKKERSRTR